MHAGGSRSPEGLARCGVLGPALSVSPRNGVMIRGKTPQRDSAPPRCPRFDVSGRRPLGGGVRLHQSLQRMESNMTSIKSALERRLAERQEGRGLLAHRASRRRHHHRHPRRDRDPDLHRCPELAKDSAAQADLANAKTAVVAYYTSDRQLPGPIDSATLSNYGYSSSSVSHSSVGHRRHHGVLPEGDLRQRTVFYITRTRRPRRRSRRLRLSTTATEWGPRTSGSPPCSTPVTSRSDPPQKGWAHADAAPSHPCPSGRECRHRHDRARRRAHGLLADLRRHRLLASQHDPDHRRSTNRETAPISPRRDRPHPVASRTPSTSTRGHAAALPSTASRTRSTTSVGWVSTTGCQRHLRFRRRQPPVQAGQRLGELDGHVPHNPVRADSALAPDSRINDPQLRHRPGLGPRHRRDGSLGRHRTRDAGERRGRPDHHRHDRRHRRRRLHLRAAGGTRQVQDRGRAQQLRRLDQTRAVVHPAGGRCRCGATTASFQYEDAGSFALDYAATSTLTADARRTSRPPSWVARRPQRRPRRRVP